MFGIEGSHCQVSSVELVGQLAAVLVQATIWAFMNEDWSLLPVRTVSEEWIVGKENDLVAGLGVLKAASARVVVSFGDDA